MEKSGVSIWFIILLVALYIMFNPIPGPVDDIAVAGLGAYKAISR